MAESKYSIGVGDFVETTYGGPLMRICELSGEWFICRWFNSHNDLKQDQFREEELVLVKSYGPGEAGVQ